MNTIKPFLESILICASTVLVLVSFNSCNSSNNSTKGKGAGLQKPASEGFISTFAVDPCVYVNTPPSCDTCGTGNTAQCYIDLDCQHKIPDNMVKSYKDRIVGDAYLFTPQQVKDSIANTPCTYKFVMQITPQGDGTMSMNLFCTDAPVPDTLARMFPVTLIQHLLPPDLNTIDSFEFYWLKSPKNCSNHESILMVVKKNMPRGYDFYDVSIPPDFN